MCVCVFEGGGAGGCPSPADLSRVDLKMYPCIIYQYCKLQR